MSGWGRVRAALNKSAPADLWRHTLSQIPTLIGRLAYLSSLRDPNTGEYAHHGLEAMFGAMEAAKALGESHRDTFAAWLDLGLEQQQAELDAYFSGLEAGRRQVVESWTRLTPYRGFPPQGALQVERDLFAADIEALLALLRNEYGVIFSDPTA